MAHYTVPTSEMFVYNRKYPPLFFAVPNEEERRIWEESMQAITREYFKMSRQYGISEKVPLSNALTAGEFAMYLLTVNHEKRNRN